MIDSHKVPSSSGLQISTSLATAKINLVHISPHAESSHLSLARSRLSLVESFSAHKNFSRREGFPRGCCDKAQKSQLSAFIHVLANQMLQRSVTCSERICLCRVGESVALFRSTARLLISVSSRRSQANALTLLVVAMQRTLTS